MDWIGWILLSWLAADFIAGFVHWWEDRYTDHDTFLIGRLVGGPNKLHHSRPLAFLEGSYWQRNYTTILPSMAVCCVCLWYGSSAWLTFAFLSQANEVHAWQHQKGRVNWIIEALQETGLVQSPRSHAAHHKAPFDCRYCVMSDLLNPWLDRVKFWYALEWLVASVLRVKVKA